MQINNNTASAMQSNYSKQLSSVYASMTKLASGKKVSAGENPSELGMSERIFADIRNRSAEINNLENNMSYMQTADSWMQNVGDMMGRMSELAVMANDGTKSESDRSILQEEFSQLQQEIKRVTTGETATASFNGQKILQGDNESILSNELRLSSTNSTTIGSYASYTYDDEGMTLVNSSHTSVSWDQLMSGEGINISTQAKAEDALAKLQVGIDHLNGQRASVGADMERTEYSISALQNAQENSMSTHNRIRNTDVAWEATQQSQSGIQQQVSIAMLAQSNVVHANVLQLLQR